MTKKFNQDLKKIELKVPYIVKKEEKGFSVECIDLDIVSQGDTLQEARKNIREAISLHLKSSSEMGILDEQLEKLGVVKKKSKLEVSHRDLESAQIEIPAIL